jgi:hypothetical protein
MTVTVRDRWPMADGRWQMTVTKKTKKNTDPRFHFHFHFTLHTFTFTF